MRVDPRRELAPDRRQLSEIIMVQHVGRPDRVVWHRRRAAAISRARRARAADLAPVEGEPVRAEAVLLARRRPLDHKGRQLVGAPRRDAERVRPGDAVREGPQERKVRVDERNNRRALEVDRSVVEEVLHSARLVVEVVRLARGRVLVELRRDVEREARARAVEGRVARRRAASFSGEQPLAMRVTGPRCPTTSALLKTTSLCQSW